MLAKLAAVEGSLAMVIIAASNALDGTAEKIVLWAAAGAGLIWFWANVARPIAKIVKRTAAAVEAFEDLPADRERLDRVERAQQKLENGQAAIIRELGIEDQVRRMDPTWFDPPAST